MNMRLVKLITISALIGCTLFIALSSKSLSGKGAHAASNKEYVGTGYGTVEALEANYNEWEAQYVKEGGDRNWVIPMGWFKGLSTGHTYASGMARLNLIDGTVSVDVKGLTVAEGWDVWLVDNGVGSVLPEAGENMLRIGSLRHEGKVARLKADLGSRAFADFELDLIVITRAGMSPIEDRTMVGTTTLFHRLYRSKQRGTPWQLSDHARPETVASKRGVFARLLDTVMPTVEAQIGPQEGVNNLITRGRNGFFNNTFNGNGRTCGTCHREDESLTINAQFISSLPLNDPLFVAETQPALANNFENPILMRKFGLILENVDGFENLASKFVMRGVPHTLALVLPTTRMPRSDLLLFLGIDTTTVPPVERLGWGGDGAPGTGSLREFITGAIIQHYPKTLARRTGTDFRLPTVGEFDEFEAFMLSTGRRTDLILTGTGALRLKDERAARGQVIFNAAGTIPNLTTESNAGAGKCFACHNNGGAGDGIEARFFNVPPDLTSNANFNTGVENQPSRPQKLAQPAQLIPRDGGFGRTPNGDGQGGFGNGTFNVPVLVEAADTGPFFHDNSIGTIEGAVEFYNSVTFNSSPAGQLVGGIRLEATEVEAVGAFLRAINALENIRSARDLLVRAKSATNPAILAELFKLAIAEADDARGVLLGAHMNFTAQQKLGEVVFFLAFAPPTGNDDAQRDAVLDGHIQRLDAARSDIRF